jgi:hypothetical protein
LFGSTDLREKTGYRTWLWVLAPLGFGCYYFFFGPIHFYWSPIVKVPSINPHFGYVNETEAVISVILQRFYYGIFTF